MKRILQTTSLKANIIANFAGNAWVSVISLIFVPIYLKYIGAEGYGLIGIFTSLQIVLSLLDSGLSTTLNKEIAKLIVLPGTEGRMRNLVRTLGNVYWMIAALAALIALAISSLMARYWVHPKQLSVQTVTYAFMLLSLSLMFQFPCGFYSGGLLGLQRQVMLNITRIAFATVRSVGAALVLIFFSNSILVFFGWSLLIVIIQAFTLKYYLWYFLPKSNARPFFDRQELKNVGRFAAGMLGISLTSILFTQVDKIILSKILSLEQFGYYSISCTLGLMILQAVAPFTQSFFPKFSNLVSLMRTVELTKLYHQACQMISVLVLPATFVLVFFSRELIFIWTKNAVTAENTWLITAIYAYGTGMNGLINIPFMLTLAYGWTKLSFYQNLIFLVLLIPLTIFFAIKFGAVGGALSWATINTLYFFITPHLIHNRYLRGEVKKWYWQDSVKPLIACVVIIFAARYFINISMFSPLIQLCIIISIGLLAIAGSLYFSADLKMTVRNLITKKAKLNG